MYFEIYRAEAAGILSPTSGFIAPAGFTHSLSGAQLHVRVRRRVHVRLLRRRLQVLRRGVSGAVSIVGDRPESGMRLRLVLDPSKQTYEGTATTPDAQWPVRVDLEGDVSVKTDAPEEVAEYTRRVVRIAAKNAKAEGVAVPRVRASARPVGR